MKIWVDDVRPAPEGWEWAKTSAEAIDLLVLLTSPGMLWCPFENMSLDHDLGGDDTARRIVLWCCENDFWPVEKVTVHSANPVGIEWLEGMINRYGPYDRMCPGDSDFCPHHGCTTCQGAVFYFKDPDNGKGRIPEDDTEAWKQYVRRYGK